MQHSIAHNYHLSSPDFGMWWGKPNKPNLLGKQWRSDRFTFVVWIVVGAGIAANWCKTSTIMPDATGPATRNRATAAPDIPSLISPAPLPGLAARAPWKPANHKGDGEP